MIDWLKKKQKVKAVLPESSVIVVADSPDSTPLLDSQSKSVFLSRFKQGLRKTHQQLGEGIARLLLGKKEIDTSVLADLEDVLLAADIGFTMTKMLIDALTAEIQRHQLADAPAILALLKKKLTTVLLPCTVPLATSSNSPFVILMVGVNGAGKTTTIGKLAQIFQQQGKSVLLAAGDTFRAAAVEQLQAWGLRNQVPVIAQHTGADSASVIFDAFQAAKARGIDILIADTAGRLHTQDNLMSELQKVKRVLQKIDPTAPHEVMLVLDASIGQNALNQAREFNEAIGVTGITMTKLDGTAKGGIVFAIAHALAKPLRYIGIGEALEDLRVFDPVQFVDAIVDDKL